MKLRAFITSFLTGLTFLLDGFYNKKPSVLTPLELSVIEFKDCTVFQVKS